MVKFLADREKRNAPVDHETGSEADEDEVKGEKEAQGLQAGDIPVALPNSAPVAQLR